MGLITSFLHIRLAWQSLGKLSRDAAKLQFVRELHRLAPTLAPYVEACWADHLHQLVRTNDQNSIKCCKIILIVFLNLFHSVIDINTWNKIHLFCITAHLKTFFSFIDRDKV